MKIIINNSVPDSEICELFDPNGEKVGDILNIYGFYRVRVEIAEKQLSGYYIVWKGQKLPITTGGRIWPWPDGFSDFLENHLFKLF